MVFQLRGDIQQRADELQHEKSVLNAELNTLECEEKEIRNVENEIKLLEEVTRKRGTSDVAESGSTVAKRLK